MSKSAADMVFGIDLNKISSKRQSSSKMAKERAVLPQSNRNPINPDMLKSKYGVGPSFSDPGHKRRQGADGLQEFRNCSHGSVKESATDRDELVKHMSNLPDYLRRSDRGENFQKKALNFGVLDWTRLEKWNKQQKHIPALVSKYTSFNNSESSSRTAIKSSTNASNYKCSGQQHLLSSNIKASYKDGLPDGAEPSFESIKRFQDSETKSSRDEQRKKPWICKSSGKTCSDMPINKEKRKDSDKMSSQVGNLSSNLRNHGVSIVSNEIINCKDDEAGKNMEGSRELSLRKKGKSRKSTSDIGLTSKNKGVSHDSKKNLSSSGSKTVELQESDIDVDHKQSHSKPSNIVLLCPRKTLQPSSQEVTQLSHLRISLDENIAESSQSWLSNDPLHEEVSSEELCSDIPHSCPLPSLVEPAATADTIRQRTNTDWARDHSSVLSKTPSCSEKVSSLHSEGAFTEKDALDFRFPDQYIFGKLKESLEHETAELSARRDKNSSPSRRFSFSLSRIGRSFSFKEGSSLSQFSSSYVSAQSGPMTSTSARLDNPSKEKANCHNRTRSSPLRRLLDPILKHKTGEIHHPAESSQTPKGILDSISFRTISESESLHIGKSEGPMIQALLQFTVKNGLPLFKFVLNNNDKNILAAAMKNLASPGKDDSGCNFTFYLVNEIKKKTGSWITQGNKERNCGYVYNVVGHMKVSSSKIAEPTGHNSKRQCKVKEYILLGVVSQTEKGLPKFSKNRELGAVVVEVPRESFSLKELCSDKNLLDSGCLKCLAEDRCSCDSGENEAPGSTTVILPVGIHGSPEKGEPSPLIYRWKSGGSCDCGGWDIGCRLLVLSSQKRNSKSFPGRFQLFDQEGAEQNSPLFSLVPLKDGFYSVEFHSSITHLQAFFISVTALSSQKLAGSIEMSKMHEEIAKEPSLKDNDEFQGKEPVRYTPIPPLSPVGRV